MSVGRFSYLKPPSESPPVGESYIKDIKKHLGAGNLLPIISNSVRNDWILDVDFNKRVGSNDVNFINVPDMANLEEELAQYWAREINYPFKVLAPPDSLQVLLQVNPDIFADNIQLNSDLEAKLVRVVHDLIDLIRVGQYENLARVAQYNRIKQDNPDKANSQYLTFLKQTLLQIARQDELYLPTGLVDELEDVQEVYSFADLAHELGYPRFNEEYPDLLRKLAQLPIKIYVTTSYYDFLERLLQAEGKQPKTQICFRTGEPTEVLPEHRTLSRYEATVEKPLVYHLYGLERYPASLVISEQDYLDFLVAIAKNTNSNKPIIPLYLEQAISDSSLVMMGYRLQDWDFRVLFHGLISANSSARKSSLAIQLDPEEQENVRDRVEVEKYLDQYFKPAKFTVAWCGTVEFVNKLWAAWYQPARSAAK